MSLARRTTCASAAYVSLLVASAAILLAPLASPAAAVAASLHVVAPLAVDASTGPYAPLNRPGPPLEVPPAKLAASLRCTSNVVHPTREPVLLVPGTTVTPSVNFSWNYERAFDALGIPWCAVTLPENAMADIQVAGEYVVHAIRRIHALSGGKVEILVSEDDLSDPRPGTRPAIGGAQQRERA